MNFVLVVPTLNAGSNWPKWLNAIEQQTVRPDTIIMIDSSSTDDTVQLAQQVGIDVHFISSWSFNHGGTRNYAAKLAGRPEVLVFLTQDAVLSQPQSLEFLLSCFSDSAVSAVCGRQIPHDNANPLAVHARMFNYPNCSEIKSSDDIPRLGIKTVFMSNSFAAYRTNVFTELGGFPENTILAEDMFLTAKMIQAGYKVAYCAEASVNHSHNYSPWEEFRRYFDTGVFHACEPWIQQTFGGANGEGMRYIRSEFSYLLKNAPSWIPRALITNACKFTGYKLGRNYQNIPVWLRSKLSMYKSYWLQQSSDS